MDASNYGYCLDSALKCRAKGFNLAELLREHHDATTWFSHLLCEANELSPLGLGGQAYRCWVSGLYRDGVYVHSDTYRLGVCFASDPTARVTRGCQDSCCNGDPWPRLSDGARWLSVNFRDVPEEMRQRILAIAAEIVREGANAVLRRAWVLRGEQEAEAEQRDDERHAMLAAWGG